MRALPGAACSALCSCLELPGTVPARMCTPALHPSATRTQQPSLRVSLLGGANTSSSADSKTSSSADSKTGSSKRSGGGGSSSGGGRKRSGAQPRRLSYPPIAKPDPGVAKARCGAARGDWCGRYDAQEPIPFVAPPPATRMCMWGCNFVGEPRLLQCRPLLLPSQLLKCFCNCNFAAAASPLLPPGLHCRCCCRCPSSRKLAECARICFLPPPTGVCDATTGWCRCPAGWKGDDCSTRMRVRARGSLPHAPQLLPPVARATRSCTPGPCLPGPTSDAPPAGAPPWPRPPHACSVPAARGTGRTGLSRSPRSPPTPHMGRAQPCLVQTNATRT